MDEKNETFALSDEELEKVSGGIAEQEAMFVSPAKTVNSPRNPRNFFVRFFAAFLKRQGYTVAVPGATKETCSQDYSAHDL